MKTNEGLILDAVLIDYLRLATFDYQQWLALLPKLRMMGSGWKGAKWLQYTGQRSKEGYFYGIGEQSKRPHVVLQASGAAAHQLFQRLLPIIEGGGLSTFYCTRIDLQATKQRPEAYKHLAAYKRLRGKKSVILGDDGSTLYIGARTSDTFWRIYDKTAELLRVEIELKGKQAKRTWASILQGFELGGIWNTYLLRSKVPAMLTEIYRWDGERVDLAELEPVVDLESKLEWLATLDSLVFKLTNDHDVGERARMLVKRWSEYGQNLDR
jgi:hypothetical protein